MRFEDQIRLINQHTDIFTTAGSAVYNVLFALHRPRLHMLTSEVPRADYFLTPAVAETPTTFLTFWAGAVDRGSTRPQPSLRYPQFVDYLESPGC